MPIDDENRARLEPYAEILVGGDLLEQKDLTAAVIGGLKIDGTVMDALGPQFKAICRPGIGVDTIDLDAATERGILVIHTPDAPTESTAEHAVALMLAVCKRVVTGQRWCEDRSIPRNEMQGLELLGRTLGIVGFGRIGRRVAEICVLGLRMKAIVFDPYVTSTDVPYVEFTNDLDYLLASADVVTLHTPLTAQTRHYIGEKQLKTMRRGTYLVNASRGPVVDEAALIRALQEGHLAGAALDVFDPEPPLLDNPLLKMNNVVCTPHIASYTDRGSSAMRNGVVDQLISILQGERPRSIANAAVWPGRMAAK
jgi:D-3-phosphoglycerate dehydrogenase